MAKATGKVWHIFHYAQLFRAVGANGSELEMVRYSQRPIVGFNQYAEQFVQQMAALKAMLPLPEFVMARYVFEELLDHAQKHHNENKPLRGYVLDERLRPAGAARIAQMIGIKEDAVQTHLKMLEKVGLIERVDMPTWNSRDTTSTRLQETVKGKKKFKPRPSASVNVKEEKKVGLSASKGEKKAAPKCESQQPEEFSTRPGTEKAEGPGEREPESRELASPNCRSAASPPATPPIADGVPTETDGGDATKDRLDTPDQLDSLYDQRGYAFARAVYEAIRTPHPMDSPFGCREIESFASVWQTAVTLLGKPSLLETAWNTGLKHAGQIAKARRRNPKKFTKSPEAVWCAKFKGLVAKLKAG